MDLSMLLMFISGMLIGSYFSDKKTRKGGAVTGQMPPANYPKPPKPKT